MHVARLPMLRVLEVVIFKVRQRMTHVLLTAEEWAAVVEQLLAASHRATQRDFLKVALRVEFRSHRAGTQLRRGEIEVIDLLRRMI